MYHKIIICGNLGQDPILRYTSAGKAVCNLSVATSNSFTTAAGVKVDETIWWKVAVWGAQAENCQQYLAKGRTVLVEARASGQRIQKSDGKTEIKPTVFTGQDGIAKASFEVTASMVKFIGRGGVQVEAAGEEAAPAADDEWDGQQIPF